MFNNLSFRSQLLLLLSGLTLLTTLVVTSNNWLKTADYVDANIKKQMHFAENVLQQNVLQQAKVLATAARVLAADFGFKQAVATRDNKTIQSVLGNHGKRINADLMVLIDRKGKLVAAEQESSNDKAQAISDSFATLEITSGAQILSVNDQVYQLIVVPVKAPRVIAYAVVGFQFDKAVLMSLKNLVSLDITLVREMQVVQSSLSDSALAAMLTHQDAQSNAHPLFSSNDYFHQQIQFGNSEQVKAILSASLVEVHDEFRQLILSTFIGAAAIIIFAIGLSNVFSKRITSPLKLLMGLTKRLGQGNFDIPTQNKKLPVEFDELYSGFEVMSHAISEREKEIKFQAESDILTGLYNRQKLLTELNLGLSSDAEILIINFNIQGFKGLNDTIGIANGDKILIEIANRLLSYQSKLDTPENVVLSRTHSDEFVIAHVVHSMQEVNDVVHALQEELAQPHWVEGLSIGVKIYFGLSHTLAHGRDAEKLLRRATMAASNAVKEQVVIREYQQGEDEAYLYKLNLIEELKLALEAENSPMFMHYQPKLNLANNKVEKVEALIRWKNTKGEFVNPELFVELAEKSGLIVDLTQWVIRQVAKQITLWQKLGHEFNVSINLSAQDIEHKDFVEYLLSIVKEYDLKPTQLTLELTERDLAENEQILADRLLHLKVLGFRVSIDDYGIGQSSLAKLKNLPVDELKIDKCFILTLDESKQDQDIVSSTISLGHNLGLSVVAEGVENLESLELLKQQGCDYIQGYYLSRPLGPEQLIEWLESND